MELDCTSNSSIQIEGQTLQSGHHFASNFENNQNNCNLSTMNQFDRLAPVTHKRPPKYRKNKPSRLRLDS